MSAPSLLRRGLSPEALARAIFKVEIPEAAVQSLPAQSVYLAIQSQGVDNADDLIALLTPEQYKACLDLDLWNGDQFNETNFWNWLVATDAEDSLAPLGKLLGAIDLKLIGFLIARNVEIITFEEPTENPPGAHYYTPDRGYTWIYIHIEDAEQYRLMGKLLAYIFESSAELFYQLASLPSVSTQSELEESSYQDKIKRLADEGLPDAETASIINAPISLSKVKSLLHESKQDHIVTIESMPIIEPIVYAAEDPDRLNAIALALREQGAGLELEKFEAEFCLILNAALQFFVITLSDFNETIKLVAKVKGAINIGIELAEKESDLKPLEIYRALGLQQIYKIGLQPLLSLNRAALHLPTQIIEELSSDLPLEEIVTGAKARPPEYPKFLKLDGSYLDEGGKLATGWQPFTSMAAIDLVQTIISKHFGN